MTFTIATLNVNGIRAAVKERSETNLGMIPWLRDTSADVVLVQEVRATDVQATAALAPAIDDGWHWVGAENEHFKGRAGVGILSRVPLSDVQVGFNSDEFGGSGRYISATVSAADSGLGDDLRVASLYLPSGSSKSEKQDEKYRFLDAFGPYLEERGRAGGLAVVGGDWNICHREQDLKNWKTNRTKSGFLPQERAWMDSVFGCWPDSEPQSTHVNATDRERAAGAFTDGSQWMPPALNEDPVWFDVMRRLHPEADGPWSWWTYRGKAFDTDAGWRIDYQAATKPMLDRAISARVEKPAAYDLRWTDHAPVIVEYQ
ncbi:MULTISPECIES: exodeoxyribonuclease III [unclassified Corynebacterium]|uniref:exodeoxyribonuclease III n=1 Tax=unclassified Corynebacterium TaxID=2624378 RepID=UPI0030B0FF30